MEEADPGEMKSLSKQSSVLAESKKQLLSRIKAAQKGKSRKGEGIKEPFSPSTLSHPWSSSSLHHSYVNAIELANLKSFTTLEQASKELEDMRQQVRWVGLPTSFS